VKTWKWRATPDDIKARDDLSPCSEAHGFRERGPEKGSFLQLGLSRVVLNLLLTPPTPPATRLQGPSKESLELSRLTRFILD
jgi:hypothetical protein